MTSRKHLSLGLTLSFLVVLTSSIYAQVPDPLTAAEAPQPGSGHHYIGVGGETVNPADGTLTFDLPLEPPTGRGISTTFGIRYAGAEQYYPGNACITGTCTSNNNFFWHASWDNGYSDYQVGPWSYTLPILTAKTNVFINAYVSEPEGTNCLNPINNQYNTLCQNICYGNENYVFRGFDGTQYSLPIASSYGDPKNYGLSCPSTVSAGNDHGILSYFNSGGSTTTVIDQSGTSFQFPSGSSASEPQSPGYIPTEWGILASSITDRNGNTINLSGNSYVDSTGRTAIKWTGIGNNGDTITISGLYNQSTGQPAPVTVHWTTATATFPENYYVAEDDGPACTLSNQLDSNNWGSGTSVALPVINEIDLPNGQKYKFQYESIYGKVEKITFPDGGYVRYEWGVNPLSALTSGAWNQETWNGSAYVETQYNCTLEYDTPAVTDRYVSYDGSTEPLHQHFQYSTTWSGETWTQKTTTVTATDSLSGDETTTKYTYSAATSDNPPYSGESYYSTEAPVETTVDYQDGNEKEYKQVNKDWWNPNIMSAEQTILYDANGNPSTGSAIAHCFDANEQVIGTYEYDFSSTDQYAADPCSSNAGLNQNYFGPLLRKTTTTYEPWFTWNQNSNPPYSGTHIVNAVENVTVADSGGNTAKYSAYTYDSPSTVTSSGAINLVSPPEAHRGNITTVQDLISGSTYSTTIYTYWDTGQVHTRKDPCEYSGCGDVNNTSHQTTFSYSDDYTSGTAPGQTFAYLTQVTNPLTQNDYFSWGFNDGLIRSHTDKNGLVTSYSYADVLARLTQISYPDNGQTNVSYNDSTYATSNSNPSANTPNMQTSGTHLNKTTIVARDGMGHTVRSMITSDPQGTIFSDTTYDGFGRAWKQSNPYRNSDPTTSAGTTVFAYDAVSRKISDTYPDGSVTSTSYSGATTTVTDPSGRQRETRVNGLGFLAEADEEGYGTTPGTPGTGTATINGSEQSTQYTCGPNNQQCTMYDTGDVHITVNGTQYTYGYGQGSTDAAIASGLATAMNNGTLVTATVNGSTITMTARTDGSGTNYSLSTSVNWNTSYFTNPSFTASLSGSALTGGTNGSSGYSLGTPAVSLYAYTALGDLRCAIQKGTDTTSFSFPLTTCGSPSTTWRPRSFTYDLLSHLLTSSNPETGTLTYTYDYNGNVWTKTDARSITTTYGYDETNRLLSRTYSNGDPTVTIAYDQSGCLNLTGCQNIGYRTSMTDAAGSESWAYLVSSSTSQTEHQDQRITSGVTKSSTYFMNQAGDLTQVVYPTGRTVNYTYNGANRPATAADSSNGITYTTSPSSPLSGCPSGQVCYTPQGSVYSMAIGKTSSFTGVNIAETFNSRLQPNTITASSTGGNAINLTYAYNDPNGHNAGDVYGITNSLNSSRSQLYTYDPLDRILSAGTTSTTGTYCWGYLYTLDTWGNMSQSPWTPTYSGCTQANPASLAYSAKNQVTTFGYDASGNTQSDGSNSYTWNGEGQQKSAASTTYTYDGDGRRVVKSNGTLYWYGAGDGVLAETNSSGTTTSEYVFFGSQRVALLPAGSTPQYYVEDSLGTSRVMTTNTGGICYDADFTPFGGERAYTNTCTQNTFKFTGKERDSETGNDYFGARYYASSTGRMLSPDRGMDQHPMIPQSWNLYTYARNNPLKMVDPTGNYVCGTNASGATMSAAECDQFQHYLNNAQLEANKLKAKYGADSTKYKDAQRAIDAYGTENVNNGVTVNIGSTAGGYPGTTEAKDDGTVTQLNSTGQNIAVTINSDVYSSGSTDTIVETVAHEGSHVGDAEDWASAGFTEAARPTNLDSEFRAYGVTSSIAEAQGFDVLIGNPPGRQEDKMLFWDSRLPQAVNEAIRTNMIKSFYPNWAEKAWQQSTRAGGTQ